MYMVKGRTLRFKQDGLCYSIGLRDLKEYFFVSGLNYVTWPSVKVIFPCFKAQLLYVAFCKRNISLFQDSITLRGRGADYMGATGVVAPHEDFRRGQRPPRPNGNYRK